MELTRNPIWLEVNLVLQLVVETSLSNLREGSDNFAMRERYADASSMYKRGASRDFINADDKEESSGEF